jgi:tetratricopeptide (TPR) repeat protein
VSDLLIGLLTALMATNQPAAVSNLVTQTTGLTVAVPDLNDPVEKEFHKIMVDDDAALDEVDKWIQDNNAFAEKGGGIPAKSLNERIHARLDPVRRAYEDFLQRHPDHARAHLAFGSFLDNIKEEDASQVELEKSRALDPTNPAAWNQLANFYGHRGPVKKAFEYYARAIELNPSEPTYYRNMATTVYLFRKDAKEYYHIEEQQVFDKALGLYEKAFKLEPNDFELAHDLAQTYYGIKPLRAEAALAAWTNALKVATSDIERQGVYIHFARIQLLSGRFAEAQQNLDSVTNEFYAELKKRVTRSLHEHEDDAKTNSAPTNVKLDDSKK